MVGVSDAVDRQDRAPHGMALLVPIPVAGLRLLNPILAGAAMALSSVSVVSNGLRLHRFRRTAAMQRT